MASMKRRIAVLVVYGPVSAWQPLVPDTQVIEAADDVAYLLYRSPGSAPDREWRDDEGGLLVALKHFTSQPQAKAWILRDILFRHRRREQLEMPA
jgi:hypothetical protein